MKRNRLIRLAAAGLVLLGAAAVEVAAAAPASAVPNLVLVSAQSAYDSAGEKSATAACPTGTRVLGGGAYIYGGNRHVHLTRLQALGSSDTYVASATEGPGYSGNWRVYAYGICGQAPAGLEYVSYHSFNNSDGYKSATATCPAGKKLISVGARTHGGGGQVVIDDIMPSNTLNWVQVTTYEDESGYAGNWSMWAYGVCANPLPGLEFRTATGPVDSTDDVVGVACSPGKKVHGVGGSINGGLGEVRYAGLYPAGGLGSATAIALEEPNGQSTTWYTRVYAICAN